MDRSSARRRVRHVLVAAFVVAYLAAMGGLTYFTPWTWTNVPFLALNAVVAVNVAYVAACAVASALPYPGLDRDEPATWPSVALLYCTYNDAVPEAIESLLAQDYPDVDVYVLDDSTDPDARQRIDDLVEGTDATLIRRDDRSGFKAGAINHWLDEHGADYAFFGVADADSYLPADWTREMVARLHGADDVAMLHARSDSYGERTRFARMIRGGIAAYMAGIGRAEAGAGPMLSWGHHVLIRRDAVEQVGGFVEARAEDLATSMQLMKAGWDVTYTPDVLAYEQSPPNYAAVRKRNMRWGEGTLEALSFADGDVPGNARLSLAWRSSAFLAGPALLATVVLVLLGHPAVNPGLMATWTGMVVAAALLPFPAALQDGRWDDMVSYWVGSGLIALVSLVSSTYLVVRSLWGGEDFVVTPKTADRIPLAASVKIFGMEVVCGLLFVAVGVLARKPVGVLWGLLFVAIPLVNTWTSPPIGDGDAVPEVGSEADVAEET